MLYYLDANNYGYENVLRKNNNMQEYIGYGTKGKAYDGIDLSRSSS